MNENLGEPQPRPGARLLLFGVALLLLLGPAGSGAAGCRHQRGAASDSPEQSPAHHNSGEAVAGEANASSEDADAPEVQVATARIGTIEQTLGATGTLVAPRDRQAIIVPPVAGVLDAVPVRLGQQVRRGQVVAHLSTRPLLGQIQQAQATIAQNAIQVRQARANAVQQQAQARSAVLQAQSAVSGARATLAGAEATLTGNRAALVNARETLARTQTLFADGLAARKDVEAAQLAVRTAEAQVAAQQQNVAAQRETVRSQQQAAEAARAATLQNAVKREDVAVAGQQLQSARAALATAQAQRALYTLRAPLSGVVTSVGASIGESVDTTTKILTIANLDALQLQIALPAASAGRVHVGQPVRFSVDALPGRSFTSVIRNVGTQVDPANNTVTLIADVSNSGHRLKDAMFARVGIVTGRRRGVLLVPRAAVLFEPDGPASVVKIGRDNVAHKTDVQVGATSGNVVEIRSGLRAGDRVATTGAYGLPDGTKVKIVAAADNANGEADVAP